MTLLSLFVARLEKHYLINPCVSTVHGSLQILVNRRQEVCWLRFLQCLEEYPVLFEGEGVVMICYYTMVVFGWD